MDQPIDFMRKYPPLSDKCLSTVPDNRYSNLASLELENEALIAWTDHSASGDGGRRRVVDVVRLEDDLAAAGHGHAVAVGQRQRPVVVQHRVEVLDPHGVDGTVQHDPHVLAAFRLQRFAPQRREDAVRPVVGRHVQPAEHLRARDRLQSQ